MASETDIRMPEATVTWPFGEVYTDYVQLTAEVNLHPTVLFTAHSGEDAAEQATPMLGKESLELMGKVQKTLFTERSSPDCSVSLDDGAFGYLDAKGFLVSPQTTQSRRDYQPAFQFNWASSLLNNLKLDIYALKSMSEDDLLNGKEKAAMKDIDDDDLAQRFLKITKALVKTWEEEKGGNDESEFSADLKEQRHAVNQKGPMQAWEKLLENSELKRDWLSSMSDNDGFNSGFNNDIATVLLGVSNDFGNVLASLMGMFQLVMIPDQEGGEGKLVFLHDLITGEDGKEKYEMLPEQVFLKGGTSFDILPIQQVFMRGLPANMWKSDPGSTVDAGLSEPPKYGGWPAKAIGASGETIIVEAPGYMPRVLVVSSASSNQMGSLPPDYTALDGAISQLGQKASQFTDETVKDMVEDYCKSIYVDRSLGGSIAMLDGPMDLTAWPGSYRKVVDEEGEPVFEGVLSGVVHSMRGRKGAIEASTQLTFTHVRYPGFELPNEK